VTSPSRLPGRALTQTRDTAQGAPRLPLFCAKLAHTALSSQNQMFSKFNALGLDNLLASALSGGSDISSDINSKLKS
jgi:hypothetical protein